MGGRWGRPAQGFDPPPLPPPLQGATATLGIYVDSGSVYETPFNTGAPRCSWQGLAAAEGNGVLVRSTDRPHKRPVLPPPTQPAQHTWPTYHLIA